MTPNDVRRELADRAAEFSQLQHHPNAEPLPNAYEAYNVLAASVVVIQRQVNETITDLYKDKAHDPG